MISSTFMLQCNRYYTNNAIGLQHLSQTNSLPLLTLCRLRTLRVRTRALRRESEWERSIVLTFWQIPSFGIIPERLTHE